MRRALAPIIAVFASACGARTALIVDEPVVDSAPDVEDAFHASDVIVETAAEDTRDSTAVIDIGAEDDGPITLPGTAAKEITLGADTTCVRTVADRLRCFGNNPNGEVGDGTKTRRTAPTAPIVDLEGVAQVGIGEQSVCARLSNGTVRCWGVTRGGLLGETSPAPDTVSTPQPVPGVVDAIDLAVGVDACVVRAGGSVVCWGRCRPDVPPPCASTPMALPGLTTAAQIATAWGSYCVRRTEGDVWCWGNNSNGQLGDGTRDNRAIPVRVAGMTDVLAIAMGGSIFSPWPFGGRGVSTCALKKDGSVYCWGLRLKDGAPREVTRPERVEGLSARALRIATNGALSCAITVGGRTECWGYSTAYGFGIPGGVPWESARVVIGAPQSVSVGVGGDRACVVGTDGLPRCWGAPLVGDGTTDIRQAPTLVVW